MLEPGTLLSGKYRIERPLGRGGSGIVYAALQEPLGRRVAVKVLRKDLLIEGSFLTRFRREAEAAAALHHPNLVAVTDLVTEGEHVFLVMERLVGASLSATIAKDGALAQDRIATIGSEVLAGLAVAHAAGLVHRDVKPDNVFLQSVGEDDESAKLLDFGIVKRNGDDTLTGGIIGTWQYMPPEQSRGDKVDGRADVYSLGASLFYAATGLRPHQAVDMDRMTFVLSPVHAPGLASLRADYDPAFCAVIDRALLKDLADRWPSATDMRTALASFTRKRLPGKTSGTVRMSDVPRTSTTARAAASVIAAPRARMSSAPTLVEKEEEEHPTIEQLDDPTTPENTPYDPIYDDEIRTVKKSRIDFPDLETVVASEPFPKRARALEVPPDVHDSSATAQAAKPAQAAPSTKSTLPIQPAGAAPSARAAPSPPIIPRSAVPTSPRAHLDIRPPPNARLMMIALVFLAFVAAGIATALYLRH